MNRNKITCDDCGIVWVGRCQFCKQYPPNVSVIKNINKKPNKVKEIPVQELPITIDNFFISTMGVFAEIDKVPEGFVKFFKSKESEYYHDEGKLTLIRISNHWGYRIRFCTWHLEGYKKIIAWQWKSKYGKKMRIGIIKITELKVNNAFQPFKSVELERRHLY